MGYRHICPLPPREWCSHLPKLQLRRYPVRESRAEACSGRRRTIPTAGLVVGRTGPHGFLLFPPFSSVQFSSVQSLSCVWLFATPWTAARQASLSITNPWSLPKFNVHWVGDAIQPSHPLSSPFPPTFNLSQHQGLFKWVSSSHQVSKLLWSFSFNISPSNKHPGLNSFRMVWFDLLAAQGTLKSFLQHQSSKASILRHSAFFTVQLSHLYMTTGKTIALDLCWQSNVSAF